MLPEKTDAGQRQSDLDTHLSACKKKTTVYQECKVSNYKQTLVRPRPEIELSDSLENK